MSQEVRFATGAIGAIGSDLDPDAPLVIVSGAHSFQLSGAEAAVTHAFSRRIVEHLRIEQRLPTLSEGALHAERLRRHPSAQVLAVGGGTAIDCAKLIGVLAANPGNAVALVTGERPIEASSRPLAAVPTTAGSGSEATHFAVVYVDGVKYSLEHESMRPRWVTLDPDLTKSQPPAVAAAAGLDAVCQSMESMWSVRSTPNSVALAREALTLSAGSLVAAVRAPADDVRAAMCRAAHLAGQAIDITRTTAPHALSYGLTSRFGVAHGHAVALTLGEIWHYNWEVTEQDVVDPRGVNHVRDVMRTVGNIMGCVDPSDASSVVADLVSHCGLPTRLRELGLQRDDLLTVADSVNPDRLRNNPRRLTRDQIVQLLDRLF